MCRVCLTVAVFFSALSVAGAQSMQPPLKLMTPSNWEGLSEKEQDLYVLGVLEGFSFDRYGNNDPDLKPLVECVSKEGVERIRKMASNVMVLGEASNPAPWWIARALGTVCKPYRK